MCRGRGLAAVFVAMAMGPRQFLGLFLDQSVDLLYSNQRTKGAKNHHS